MRSKDRVREFIGDEPSTTDGRKSGTRSTKDGFDRRHGDAVNWRHRRALHAPEHAVA